jgi:hypothetical protein
MISIELFSEKPMPAAAQPDWEFGIDTTAGMSAPPIGMMISTPSTKAMAVAMAMAMAMAVMMINGVHAGATPPADTKARPRPTITTPSARFSMCRPANTTGAPWKYAPAALPSHSSG